MLELLFGIISGLLVGLVPGLHVNNIVLFFTSFGPEFIIGLSVAFVFSSFFPSVLSRIGNEDTALAAFSSGKINPREALSICFSSAMLACALSFLPAMAILFVTGVLYEAMKSYIPFLLAAIIFVMVFSERRSLLVIIMSSFLGMLTFGNNALLPLLSGFFSLSVILAPAKNEENKSAAVKGSLLRSVLLSSLLCPIFSLFPAVSSAIVSSSGSLAGKMNSKEFLALSSATNANYMILSFYSLYFLGVARSGSAAALSGMEKVNVFQLAGFVFIASFISGMACIKAAPFVIRFYEKMDRELLRAISLFLIIVLNFFFCGFFGLIVLFASTSIGLYANYLKVSRVNCMSALMVPVIFL